MQKLKWLDGYSGQSTDALIAMASEYRIDSIVLAFEQAIQDKAAQQGSSALSEAELTILAIEALEREVNNGGYHQFFLNTPEYASEAVRALRRIHCPRTADITAQAVSLLGLQEPFSAEQIQAVLENESDGHLIETLNHRCDQSYQESGEPIADQLFAYIQANRGAVRLPS
jgi:Domain of unknown function (DUF4375)